MKKINTIPHGEWIIRIYVILSVIMLVTAVALIPKIEALYPLFLLLVLIAIILYHFHIKYWNHIYISEDMIQYRTEQLKWENTFITMNYMRPRIDRNAYDYYFYFSDHYLTQDEIESQNLLQKGFYIVLTAKRVKCICSLYGKEIRILGEAPYCRANHCILEQVKTYNSGIETE